MEQESGFALSQNRKADWPPRTVAREGCAPLERKKQPSAPPERKTRSEASRLSQRSVAHVRRSMRRNGATKDQNK